MEIAESLQFFAKLFNVHENPERGMWLLYITIVVLSAVVYKLGFARKLPLLKAAIVYFFLFAGATILTFLGVFLPIAEGLAIAALIIVLYKIRLLREKNSEERE